MKFPGKQTNKRTPAETRRFNFRIPSGEVTWLSENILPCFNRKSSLVVPIFCCLCHLRLKPMVSLPNEDSFKFLDPVPLVQPPTCERTLPSGLRCWRLAHAGPRTPRPLSKKQTTPWIFLSRKKIPTQKKIYWNQIRGGAYSFPKPVFVGVPIISPKTLHSTNPSCLGESSRNAARTFPAMAISMTPQRAKSREKHNAIQAGNVVIWPGEERKIMCFMRVSDCHKHEVCLGSWALLGDIFLLWDAFAFFQHYIFLPNKKQLNLGF